MTTAARAVASAIIESRALRLAVLVPAVSAMVAAVVGGLARVGVLVELGSRTAPSHGVLLICGLFGTLIALERAVALRQAWLYAAPVLSAVGAALAVSGLSAAAPTALWPMTAALLAAGSIVAAQRDPGLHSFTMAAGAVAYAVGTGLWAARPVVPFAAPFWVAFFVLTIAGERVELSRLRRPTGAATASFGALLLLVAVGLIVGLMDLDAGARLLGVAWVGVAAWIGWRDIARFTLRRSGLPRFVAVCVLSGAAWLAAAGAMGVVFGAPLAGPRYDAILHAVFVGFVLAMVMGHAPIILPAVLGVRLPFHAALYVPLGLLQLSLVARIAGDHAGVHVVRQVGSVGNAVSLGLYAAIAVTLGIALGREERVSASGQPQPAE